MRPLFIIIILLAFAPFAGAQSKYTGGNGSGYSSSTYNYPAALPVTILSFTIEQKTSTPILKWSSVTESEMISYILEYSIDGSNFSFIAEQTANVKNQLNEYLYKDMKWDGRSGYYRLSYKTVTGKLKIISTIKCKPLFHISSVTIYPNPASDKVRLLITQENLPEFIVYQLWQSDGKWAAGGKISPGEEIDIHELLPGIYWIKIEGFENTYKLIKK